MDDALQDIREQLGQSAVTLAKIEQRLEAHDQAVSEVLKILRGDGNGFRGLITRANTHAAEIRALKDRMTAVDRKVDQLRRVGVSWRAAAAIITALGASLAAVLTAVFK